MNKKIVILLLLFSFVLTACSSSSRIYGKWEADANNSSYADVVSITFNRDGTFLNETSNGEIETGTFQIEKDALLLDMEDGIYVYTWNRVEDTLIITIGVIQLVFRLVD